MDRVKSPHNPDDQREPIEILKEATDGKGVPTPIADGEGGVMSLPRVSPELCVIIRQLRDHLKTKEISDLVGFSRSTVSKHAQGQCTHSNSIAPPDGPRATPRGHRLATVTDRETMIVTGAGSSKFHKNSNGEPACGHGHRGDKPKHRGNVRDAIDAYVWNDPCKACFWRHFQEGMVSRRIAELEYELAKLRRDGE